MLHPAGRYSVSLLGSLGTHGRGSATWVRARMPAPEPPAHLRRAKLAKRAQVLLAVASAVFVLYRLAAAFAPALKGRLFH